MSQKRSKLCQGRGCDVVIKSVVEPEVNQAVQTGYLGNTSDKASVKEGYLDNQKEFFHESNFTRELAYQGVIEAWNFKKIFTDKKVMDFPSPLEGQSCSLREIHIQQTKSHLPSTDLVRIAPSIAHCYRPPDHTGSIQSKPQSSLQYSLNPRLYHLVTEPRAPEIQLPLRF
ncbi:hypothetical protein F2Q69_00048302 [Brassica cretica]|uniref:Uncharacterized protein n=1 Tax=Brassica cretica TaxID=69181 RepID=A0A8S9PFF2_BRACR|nr:hypothetical protein F2Q69_00048302 [Brassica cretica]